MSQSVKIATILPYKENYTFQKAQAAAIWVCDFFKYSKFKNTNYIFGNTRGNDYLTKNYINISIISKLSFLVFLIKFLQYSFVELENFDFKLLIFILI